MNVMLNGKSRLKGTQRFFVVVLVGCGCFFSIVSAAFAQTWMPSDAANMDWHSLASSADGSRLLAAGSSALCISTNGGVNWTSNNVPAYSWACVASSADGKNLAAGPGYPNTGYIYFSTNGGGTWTPCMALYREWGSLTMSADGMTVIALPAPSATAYYVSTNSGATWTTNALPVSNFGPIISSADGCHWAGLGEGAVFASTNFGGAWTSNNVTVSFFDQACLAFSANGNTLVAAQGGNGGLICISTNLGASWNTNTVHNVWLSAAVSADGRRLIVSGYNSIYTSADQGVTWVSNNAPRLPEWSAVASSADGRALVAAGYPGSIYYLKTTPSPSLNIGLAAAGGNLGLSWVIPSTNFVLEQSPDLASWSDVTNVPALNPLSLQYEVTLPLPNGNGFYRLVTP